MNTEFNSTNYKMKIYLSGPITGKNDNAIKNWREKVRSILPEEIEICDPGSFDYNSELSYAISETEEQKSLRFKHGQSIVDRNKDLIRSSDLVFVNFLDTDRPSIGSIGEVFWANTFDIPVLVVREEVGNIYDHAMINAMANTIVHTLEDGCNIISKLSKKVVDKLE